MGNSVQYTEDIILHLIIINTTMESIIEKLSVRKVEILYFHLTELRSILGEIINRTLCSEDKYIYSVFECDLKEISDTDTLNLGRIEYTINELYLQIKYGKENQ